MTFFKQSTGLIQLMQGTLKAQTAYLHSLEHVDMLARTSEAKDELSHLKKRARAARSKSSPEAQKLKAAVAGLGELSGKISADIAFAKREMAWGKLDATDLSELFRLMQDILLPLTGMSSVADIFERIAEKWGWTESDIVPSPAKKEIAQERRTRWNEIMKACTAPLRL